MLTVQYNVAMTLKTIPYLIWINFLVILVDVESVEQEMSEQFPEQLNKLGRYRGVVPYLLQGTNHHKQQLCELFGEQRFNSELHLFIYLYQL